MLKVVVVEDEPDLCRLLASSLDQVEGLCCTGHYESAEEALSALEQLDAVDVFLMDINLPGRSGIELVRELIERNPDQKILMHTVFEESEEVIAALKAGAKGYILKRTPFAELVQAIRDTATGGAPMTPQVARHVVRFFNEMGEGNETVLEDLEALTSREQEILEMVAKGYQNKEVARLLEISHDTVRVHLRNIFAKWQVSNRTQAVTTYLSHKKGRQDPSY